MAGASALWESLENFCQLFNEHPALGPMLKGWDRLTLVSPSDLPDRFSIEVRGGCCRVRQGPPERHHLEVVAPSELLTSLFWGEITPTEPYLDGRLLCHGSEEDLLKLDFVTAMIWE